MNLSEYLENKCLETTSIELVKQAILEDMTLSSVQKQNWLSLINTMATAKVTVKKSPLAQIFPRSNLDIPGQEL